MKNLMLKANQIFNTLNNSDLKKVLADHDDWFYTNEDPDIRQLRQLLDENDRDSIIQWFSWTDPILTEGGLYDFIEQKVKPLLIKYEVFKEKL